MAINVRRAGLQITGIDLVQKMLAGKQKQVGVGQTSYRVSYNTPYAVYVHEDLQARHPNGGQAKFLEQPAREMGAQLQAGVKEDLRKGMTMRQALLRQGHALLMASRKLVPVDTGLLKGSGKVELE